MILLEDVLTLDLSIIPKYTKVVLFEKKSLEDKKDQLLSKIKEEFPYADNADEIFNESATRITWINPDFHDEVDEYFENDYTMQYFAKHGLRFEDRDELINFLEDGKMITIPRKVLIGSDNLTTEPSDFTEELKDPGYRASYDKMQKALSNGRITLPAPILVKFPDTYYGFAGNRRMNLAWANNEEVTFWVVSV